jgi:solute carrier family 25 carnitine/acylcarnitine transporter 20/29
MSAMVGRKFVAGSFGGVCQALCSHPFDLVKSRIQSGAYPSIATCVRDTLAKEGATAFYKGVGPPIAIAGFYNAVLFGSNEAAKKLVGAACGLDARQPMPISYVMVAGVLTAPTSVAVLTPADVVKIQLQLQRESRATAQYSGMLDCVLQLWRTGGVRSLMRGYVPTLATRVVGLPGYFAGNDAGKRWWRRQSPGSSDFVTAMFGGCCAGVCFWTLCYPFDLIKTRVQAQRAGTAVKLSPTQIARDVFAQRGARGFYAGFGACLLRALPANASVMAGIDVSEKWLAKRGW